jgi:hypothetical protein
MLAATKKDCGSNVAGNTVRFHFQVRTGTHVMVTEVADFSNTEEAASKRPSLWTTSVRPCPHTIGGKDWQMDVTDEWGLILFVFNVHAIKGAAIAG